ncbi:general stress protein [Sporosarcina sp. Te-1]|uniref:general stress protein n=1 Tax=Sporosarcina sp. Te-1 TaxID=2818390 RepID=UPI001A9F2E22|nr:general stress protein [Sporosarcina sp. Te-1]QTD40348.1 general stress protein [Sporosarcina sp. Te-1]
METNYVGTFHSIDSALYKITQLKSEGYEESAIHAVTNSEDELAQLRNQTYVVVAGREDENFLSRFKAFVVGDDETAMKRMDDQMQEEIRNGGIALFVEGEPKGRDGSAERDSQAALSESGEPLQNDADFQPRNDNEGTVPRLNTDGL